MSEYEYKSVIVKSGSDQRKLLGLMKKGWERVYGNEKTSMARVTFRGKTELRPVEEISFRRKTKKNPVQGWDQDADWGGYRGSLRENPLTRYRGFTIDITPGNETTSAFWTDGDIDERQRYSGYSRKEIINDIKARIDRILSPRSNPSRRGNAIRVGDMVMGIMGVDGGYVGRVTRISGNIVTFKDDETGKERQTTEYNLTKNIPLRGEYPRRNPSRRGLLQIEKDLKKRAKRMRLTGERARAYIYGTYGRIKRASGY